MASPFGLIFFFWVMAVTFWDDAMGQVQCALLDNEVGRIEALGSPPAPPSEERIDAPGPGA
jgi:nitrogen fixation-related uncharacterized protein